MVSSPQSRLSVSKTLIVQPQVSLINPPNRNPKNIKIIMNSNKKNSRSPNWLQLPDDIWLQIFSKLYTTDIIVNAQRVCTAFLKISKQPFLFKKIDMDMPDDNDNNNDVMVAEHFNWATRCAVDRSNGELVDIYLDYCDDDTLMYIADRSKNLKHLRIGRDVDVTDEGLYQAIKKLPVLEEVQLIVSPLYSKDTVEAIGRACPSLKSFSLTKLWLTKRPKDDCNKDALYIAKNMSQLRHLRLICNDISNEGLEAILDGCPLLESLDLHACLHLRLSGSLGKRCERFRQSQCPRDSTNNYSLEAYEETWEMRAQSDNEDDYDSSSDSGSDSDYGWSYTYDDYDLDDEPNFDYEDDDCF